MKKFKIGLQLYSLRDVLAEDFEGTLRKVKEMGYECVEFAGYYGKSAEELKAILDEIGLEAISVHQRYLDVLEVPGTIDFVKKLGIKYYTVPSVPADKFSSRESVEQICEDLRKVAEALNEAGLMLLYHNHDFEFGTIIDGKPALDYLYSLIPANLLETEVDTCWVRYAGYDPAEYLRKYIGRAHVVHLKDFICKNFNMGSVYELIDTSDTTTTKKPASREEAGFQFMPVGSGIQDIPAIVEAAADAGAEYLIVEQDQAVTATSLECAKQSIDYLKSLGL